MRLVLCLILLCVSFCGSAHASPEIYINIPEYKLTVIDKGQVVKSYDIAVGTPYEQTPVGRFAVFLKLEQPTWYPGAKFADRTPVPAGPDNPLGSRWMEFAPSYGIHGTNVDWSISYPVSGGCIRMHDADARELYEVVEVGTPVTVAYETLLLVERKDGLYLKVLPDIYGRQTSSRERFLALFSPLSASWRTTGQPVFPLKETEDAYEVKFAVRGNSPAGGPGAVAALQRQPRTAPPLPE
ncbi:L,D-transpeptidase [Anaeroselena agilis]|uniref:L,D-transpeptidase n=1 Tax=Anaeroselena agilis TaxID=3063788 RepID=A0ABU3NV21_9FIRM|nr:L,D-transpeptidase [Selenomonadales bacterium 4137-cl]